jgi:hypothetical protein
MKWCPRKYSLNGKVACWLKLLSHDCHHDLRVQLRQDVTTLALVNTKHTLLTGFLPDSHWGLCLLLGQALGARSQGLVFYLSPQYSVNHPNCFTQNLLNSLLLPHSLPQIDPLRTGRTPLAVT